MTGRKVVQISTAMRNPGDGYAPCHVVTALCDDGSMHSIRCGEGDWLPIPPIPQDAEPAPAAVRAGPVTEEEISRVHGIYFDDPKESIHAAVGRMLTDFLVRRGISTAPVEYTDEQVERMCQAFETHLCRTGTMHLHEIGRTLRTYPRTVRDAMRAALAKLS